MSEIDEPVDIVDIFRASDAALEIVGVRWPKQFAQNSASLDVAGDFVREKQSNI